MGKKATSIKEYGTDLKKQYDDLNLKAKTLTNKIRKRGKMLLKLEPDHPYLEGIEAKVIDSMDAGMVLFIILRVERDYVKQALQTDLFTPIPRYLNMRFDENNKKIGDCTLCKEQFVLISEHKCGEETKQENNEI